MLNINAVTLDNGKTMYKFSSRGMDYGIIIMDKLVEIYAYNNKLSAHSVPRVVSKDSKLPKAIRAAIELIESPSVAA